MSGFIYSDPALLIAEHLLQSDPHHAYTELFNVAKQAADDALKVARNIAFVDFTKQSNGAPNTVLDTGQPVDYHFNAGGAEPVILTGRLVFGDQSAAGAGGAARYYQANLTDPIVRIGCGWTMKPGADDGHGNMTIGAWDGIYEGGGTDVPRSWVHLSIVPGTGAIGTAKWFTCDGAGNLLNIKSKTFKNPAADGVTLWKVEAVLDSEEGKAWARLPDETLMELTDAEIEAFCLNPAVNKPVQSLKSLAAKVAMIEHFCTTGANVAKFPEFKYMFAEVESDAFKLRSDSPLNKMKSDYYLRSLIKDEVAVAVSYAPSDLPMSATTLTGAQNVNTANGKFKTTVGKNGILIVIATAWYEFSVAATLFWRIAGSTGTSPTRAAYLGVVGEKCLVTQTFVFYALTPGSVVSGTLQHWSNIDGAVTCKASSSGTYYPPLSLVAIPG